MTRKEKRHDVSPPRTFMRWQRAYSLQFPQKLQMGKNCTTTSQKVSFPFGFHIHKNPEKRIWNQTEEKLCTVSPKIQCVHKASTEKNNVSEVASYNWLLSCHSLNNIGHGWRESQLKASRKTSSQRKTENKRHISLQWTVKVNYMKQYL